MIPSEILCTLIIISDTQNILPITLYNMLHDEQLYVPTRIYKNHIIER